MTLLDTFAESGVLGPADLYTARRVADLYAEPDEQVRLAAALTVRALRAGSVCVDLATVSDLVLDQERESTEDLAALPWPEPAAWQSALEGSPMVSRGPGGLGGRPLRVVEGLVYLERYWEQEEQVRSNLTLLTRLHPPVDLADLRWQLNELFPGTDLEPGVPDAQRAAAALAALNAVTVIAGGPGTGKTSTIARILRILSELAGRVPTIALAAPTGKAATRLTESVRGQAARVGGRFATDLSGLTATTMHRLLGPRPGSNTRFQHDRDNPLPHEVIVIDEMSMVSLTMMARLLPAVRPDARLILVGDPDQLSSVEAGAVMGDITRLPFQPDSTLTARLAEVADPARPNAPLTSANVVTLDHTWRYGGQIAELAAAIRTGDPERTLEVLSRSPAAGADGSIHFVDLPAGIEPGPQGLPGSVADAVRRDAVSAVREMYAAAQAGDAETATRALEQHRVLCAHRSGPYGVTRWAAQVEAWLRADLPGYGAEGDFYLGMPLLITENDASVDLANGDTGVIIRTAEGLRAAFDRGSGPRLYSLIQLDKAEPVHAMTVHKSQGSQFDRLTFVLPPLDSPLLTRELLYTAVTRAKSAVRLIGSAAAVRRAVERPANRASGLARRLR
ncbi:exodeoxyribonuclease V subunit alpha [Granulicoccus phenolivorans]|uniref:exodeoxyribonuclease V subunit alpha n=1 Tax=Granulicoccus phenolivorans TaxID=266854 RepID=UPI0004236DAE|nr:exodeoxyribonuclease V subunit alpha [Granulicoccus phenolivorans]